VRGMKNWWETWPGQRSPVRRRLRRWRRRSDHPMRTRGQGGVGGARALLEKEEGGGENGEQ
jgi:hypothetical protein